MKVNKNSLGLNNICCCNMAIEGEEAWLFNLLYPAIFKLDINYRKLELIHYFEEFEEPFYQYSYCFIREQELFLIPKNSPKGICVYNIKTGRIDYIIIEKERKSFFFVAYQVNDKIFIIGRRGKAVCSILFDMQTKKVDSLDNFNLEMQVNYNEIAYNFWCDVYMDNENMYIPCIGKACIFKYNYVKQIVSNVKLNIKEEGIYTIQYFDDCFFIATLDGTIYRADELEANKWTYIGHVDGGVSHSLSDNNILYLFPKESCSINYIEAGSDIIKTVPQIEVMDSCIRNQVLRCHNYYNSYDKTFMAVKTEAKGIFALFCDGNLYNIQNEECKKIMELKYGKNKDIYKMMMHRGSTYFLKEEYPSKIPVGLDVMKCFNFEFFILGMIAED